MAPPRLNGCWPIKLPRQNRPARAKAVEGEAQIRETTAASKVAAAGKAKIKQEQKAWGEGQPKSQRKSGDKEEMEDRRMTESGLTRRCSGVREAQFSRFGNCRSRTR